MNKIFFCLSFLFFLVGNSLQAQLNPDEILERFFRGYRSEPLQSIDYIFSQNPIFQGDGKLQAENVRQRLERAIPSLGRYYKQELIVKKKVTNSLILYSHIMKYERQPIRFTFKFYRPDRKWLLLGFSFDDNISDEMDEAARLQYILNIAGEN